jgi:hypothetical protein
MKYQIQDLKDFDTLQIGDIVEDSHKKPREEAKSFLNKICDRAMYLGGQVYFYRVKKDEPNQKWVFILSGN